MCLKNIKQCCGNKIIKSNVAEMLFFLGCTLILFNIIDPDVVSTKVLYIYKNVRLTL